MFEKNYKNAMNEVVPSDEAREKTLKSLQNHKRASRIKIKNTIKTVIASCLLLSILGASVIGIFNYASIFRGIQLPEGDEATHDIVLNGIRQAKDSAEINAILKEHYDSYTNGRVEIDGVIAGDLWGSDYEEVVEEESKPSGYGSSNTEFSDTNNQVAGVQEADIVKTDGEYIYYLSQSKKTFYIAKADNGSIVQTAKVYFGKNVSEMFLLGDTVAIIATETSSFECPRTAISYYDISDKTAPVFKEKLVQDGYYYNSRAIGSKVFVISNAYTEKEIACICGEEIAPEDVWIPDKIQNADFTIITAYDVKKGGSKFHSTASLLGVSGDLYCTKENIYITNEVYNGDCINEDNPMDAIRITNIYRISLTENELKVNGAGAVPGYALNQFSFDECDGKLRIATTSHVYKYDGKNLNFDYRASNVFCLGSDLEIIGKSEDLGLDEEIKSVRYIGNVAYVVTFRQTDPLYAIDLSIPSAPKTLSELKINGFSTYMHSYGNGLLLGIGAEADPKTGVQTGLKLTMFDISDNKNVSEISTYSYIWETEGYSYSEALYNHKAVLIDAKKGIIAIPLAISTYERKSYFVFFEFDGKTLAEKGRVDIESYSFYGDSCRALYIGDYGYIVNDNGIVSISLEKIDTVASIDFE